MKRFTFRLQVVLDRSHEEEEQRLQQMAAAQQELVQHDQEIERVTASRTAMLQAMAASQQATFEIDDLSRRRLHLDALATSLVLLQQQRIDIDKRLTLAREALCEAMRKRQTLEKLRETQHDAYRKETDRQELNQMEDVKLPRLARERAERMLS